MIRGILAAGVAPWIRSAMAARSVNGAAYYYQTTSPITTYPVTLATWCYSTFRNFSNAILSIQNASSDGIALMCHDYGTCDVWFGSGFGGIASSGTLGSNAWYHVAAVLTSNGTTITATMYNNGVAGSSATRSHTTPTWDRIGVGIMYSSSSWNTYFTGHIEAPAIWKIALSASDITALAGGASPLRVRRDALVWHVDLTSEFSPPSDAMSGTVMTKVGSPAIAALQPNIRRR